MKFYEVTEDTLHSVYLKMKVQTLILYRSSIVSLVLNYEQKPLKDRKWTTQFSFHFVGQQPLKTFKGLGAHEIWWHFVQLLTEIFQALFSRLFLLPTKEIPLKLISTRENHMHDWHTMSIGTGKGSRKINENEEKRNDWVKGMANRYWDSEMSHHINRPRWVSSDPLLTPCNLLYYYN